MGWQQSRWHLSIFPAAASTVQTSVQMVNAMPSILTFSICATQVASNKQDISHQCLQQASCAKEIKEELMISNLNNQESMANGEAVPASTVEGGFGDCSWCQRAFGLPVKRTQSVHARSYLREPQHTLGPYPRYPQSPK